ncbi:nuclease-related domain-containing protein [Cytobacillus sp. S13-E01]|uniref:nuclease-related domain-containing protein n=1 Tax=Cytobacillus sp. S13-E01 TaxID=3031326 RepID=UPI0023D893C5|nr:nuclease-related domain-containing protein [Cytobacillus sp. S13-E01]MDF0726024.1 nuclease-related domain-containing protein [Cytobacillus sp. S13-E01]
MIFKPRYETEELKVLRSLYNRSNLTVKEVNYYLNLEKGFSGEQQFDSLTEKLTEDYIVLNDLLLENNNTVFQIDTLLISKEKIYFFEVKNYEGDFYIESKIWYSITRTEIKNPLLQLNRSESLLRRLLQDLGWNFTIEPYIVFINPDFYLYQAPLNLPIIFPGQIKRFFNNNTNVELSKLNDKHLKLAKQLLSCHLENSPYKKIPEYNYDQLHKGIICVNCHSLLVDINAATFKERTLVCSKCSCRERVESAVIRSVEEFHFLFPDKKITTNIIYDWCKIIESKKTIRRILAKHFRIMGHSGSSYFIKS